MNVIYCETSVLVAALAAEANSAIVQAWIDDHRNDLTTSAWTGTELSNALAMKRRLEIIDDAALMRIRSAWRTLDDRLLPVSILDRDFVAASDLIARREVVLRSGNALHLAVAIRHGLTLATLDKKFAVAASIMNVELSAIL